ncbi:MULTISPECIES: hypothetical protein [unclassified Microcoleus]|uniref:hypothetical protein n=1 Tax=unclassified Microcoleus TaxID=2642155 RepID=UPI002FD148CB
MVTLRLQELAEAKALSLLSHISNIPEENIPVLSRENLGKLASALGNSGGDEFFEISISQKAREQALSLLSQAAGIDETVIQKYAKEQIEITKATATDLTKIAEVLKVSTLELVNPVLKIEAVKLKISELIQANNTSLEDLSAKTQIDLPTLCFYSTQPIGKQKLNDSPIRDNLGKISEALGLSSIENLLDADVELPPTRLRILEVAKEINLSLEELSLISGINPHLLDLLANHPVDITALKILDPISWNTEGILCRLVCIVLNRTNNCFCE